MGFLNEVFDQVFGTDFHPKKKKQHKKPVRVYHYYGKPIVAIDSKDKVHYLSRKKKPRR